METVIDYLSGLKENNNRQWYHEHKTEYKAANAEFEEVLQDLIVGIGEFDRSILHNVPRELTFKLVRDTRFSHDKSPYNPSFRAHIASKGKLPIPVGYYIMIKPGGGTFLGGGLFADMFKDATTMIRDYISANPEEWDQIINDDTFQKYFTVGGTALKNVPKGYDKEHPQAEYLKNKSWYVEYFIQDEKLRDTKKFIDLAVEVFKAMKPFNDYLNRALAGFTMPKR